MSIKDAISRFRQINETLEQDDPDKLEILDSEDFSALMEWAMQKRNEMLASADMCKELEATYKKRRDSFCNRADKLKDLIQSMMMAAGERKFPGIAGTASIRAVAPKPEVIDETRLPEDFWRVTRSIDKTAINEAMKDGHQIPGVAWGNGGETISIRSK